MSERRSRLRGRAALERSLRALLVRAHRLGCARAISAEDVRWCARAIDALTVLLTSEPSAPGVPRSAWEGQANAAHEGPAEPRLRRPEDVP